MENEKHNKQHPEDLLIKYLVGSANEEERIAALDWMNKSKENKLYFNELKDYYHFTKLIQEPAGFDKEAGWGRVKAGYYKARFQSSQNEKTRYKRKLIIQFGMSAAAAIAIAFLAGFYLRQLAPTPTPNSHAQVYNEIVVPLGSKSFVTLSDSTKVWLNAGSKLKYPENFSSTNREVSLEGEGFFNVAKNSNRQFVVKTNGLSIKVFGTQFNVKSYPDENEIQTTLIEGALSIEPNSRDKKAQPVFLKPNQTATFYKSNSTIEKTRQPVADNVQEMKESNIEKIVVASKVNPLPITSWKESDWVFDGEKLGDLAVKLERRYNVKIAFANKNLISYRFTGTLTEETFEQVLKIIQLSAPILYTIEGKNVVFKEDPYYKKEYDKMINNVSPD